MNSQKGVHGGHLGFDPFRGISFIRNSPPPPRTTIGPEAYSYCRVPGGRCFLMSEVPLYTGTSLITCGDFENACLFLKKIKNFLQNGCLFLEKIRNFSKNGCLLLIFFRPLRLCDVVSDQKQNIEKRLRVSCKNKKLFKNGCLFQNKNKKSFAPKTLVSCQNRFL